MPSPSSSPPSALHHFTLANGLKVYLREDHRAPLASVQLWYHVGASYEPAGHSGLSHALEHLMFAGSSKLAAGQYSSLMTLLGGSPNAFTNHEATWFPLTLPANRLEIVLEAMADAMSTARLDEHAFSDELKIVKAERRSNVDGYPLAVALERHRQLAYGTRPYATPVIGHSEDLDALTIEDARTWCATWYLPNNATLAVAGAVDLHHLQTLVHRHFASAEPRPVNTPPASTRSVATGKREQTLTAQGLRTGVLMSVDAPSQATASSPRQAYALRLLAMLLADGASSRLYRQLLRGEQVLQALRADYEPLQRGDSQLGLYAYSNPRKITPALAAERILAVAQSLGRAAIGDDELRQVKARLLARLVFARDSIDDQAASIGKYATCGLDPALLDSQRQSIAAVTAEDLRQAAHDHFTEDRLTVTCMQQENADD